MNSESIGMRIVQGNPKRWVMFVPSPTVHLSAQLAQKADDTLTILISHLGRMIFSLGSSEAKSLKVLNLTEGAWRKGLAPKLNSHCWYDMKLAAAKKPDLPRHRGNALETKDDGENNREWNKWGTLSIKNKQAVGTLTWLMKRPVSLVAADVRLDRRSSASCWGPTGNRWHLLNRTHNRITQSFYSFSKHCILTSICPTVR